MFFHGADWFVNNQDSGGGWPSNVVFNKDRKKYPGAEELEAGWYGAMCQGQAISVLVRAFHQSADGKYLEAAERAAKVFSIPSSSLMVAQSFSMLLVVWNKLRKTHLNRI